MRQRDLTEAYNIPIKSVDKYLEIHVRSDCCCCVFHLTMCGRFTWTKEPKLWSSPGCLTLVHVCPSSRVRPITSPRIKWLLYWALVPLFFLPFAVGCNLLGSFPNMYLKTQLKRNYERMGNNS